MAPQWHEYGAVPHSTAADHHIPGCLCHEEHALLGHRKPKVSLRAWLAKEVRRDWADVALLFCYIITGMLDSAAISTWGSFVSMQTGNTVYIGLGFAMPYESKRWIKSGVSLISFCVGSFCFSRFHRYFIPSRRWVLCASFLLQMVFVMAAASILTWFPKSDEETHWTVLVPIALIAFQACGQAVVSRALKYNSLTSVVLTSIYTDLFSDAELFSVSNVERNRRVGAPTLLLLGAVIGGLLVHTVLGPAGVLWIASVLKFLVALSWFSWPGA